MGHHLGGHLTHAVATKAARAVEHEVGATAQVQRGGHVQLGQRGSLFALAGTTIDHRLHLVHRQHEAEAADPALVAKGLAQGLTQGQPDIFHRVVIVDVQIAADLQLEAKARVGGYLIQHVIEEADAGGDLVAAALVQVHCHLDTGLLGVALHLGGAPLGEQLITDGEPIVILWVVADAADAHVLGKLQIGLSVANDEGVGKVDATGREVLLHQSEVGLAAAATVGGEVRADQHLFPVHPLRFKQVHHQVMGWLEVLQRQAGGAQPILIGHHHQHVPGGLQLAQNRDHHGFEAQLGEAVHLLVGHRLFYQGAVTVDKQKRGLHLATSLYAGGRRVAG
ncbi:hypothetical protein D3C79_358470 [compost metagenome]